MGNDVYLNWPCLYTWAVEQLVFLINEEITSAIQNKLDPVDLQHIFLRYIDMKNP